jgi:hypothetical protein
MVCMSARCARFQRSDINVVVMLIAVVPATKKSEFVIVAPFDNGGTFLQQLNVALAKYAKQNRQMLK